VKAETIALIFIVFIIAVLIILVAVTWQGVNAQEPASLPHYPEPAAHPACLGHPWWLLWTFKESKYCQESGTYVLWICYDEQGQELHYCSKCFYMVDLPMIQNGKIILGEALTIPTPAPTMQP